MSGSRKTLLQKVYSLRTLQRAWNSLNKAHRSSHGLSGETLEEFARSLNSNLRGIQRDLKAGTFSFSLLRAVPVRKPLRPNKIRPLRVAEVRDRVVLKAMVLVVQPYLEKRYNLRNPASYAYQKGLGPEAAIERVVELYMEGKPVAFEGDIIRFFDTVNREYLLKDLVYPVLPDDSLCTLIDAGLNQEIGNRDSLPGEVWKLYEASQGGIPQGSSLSPLLSNVYLAPFDGKMLDSNFGLVRYADDFVVMCRNEKEAREAYRIAKGVLEERLKLSIHPLDEDDPDCKSRIVKVTQTPMEFLSVRFNGTRLWPAREKVTELKEKVIIATDPQRNQSVVSVLTKTRNLIEGWIAAFYYTDIERILPEIDILINKRLAFSLRKMHWHLRRLKQTEGISSLSQMQRHYSGIPRGAEILESIRGEHEWYEALISGR